MSGASAATARDRDKVREQVLTGLGWNMLRVWSTDWWYDAAGCADRLQAALEDLLDKSRAADAEAQGHEAAQRRRHDRGDLIEREGPAGPGDPADVGDDRGDGRHDDQPVRRVEPDAEADQQV